MTLQRIELQTIMVRKLIDARTAAGDKVYAVLDFPTADAEYPIIIVHEPIRTPLERKQSEGLGIPSFTTTATFQIEARLEALTKDAANDGLNVFNEKIVRALINAPELRCRVQQFASVETIKDFNTEGKICLGQLTVNLALEFYEGPEDFAPIDADDLQGIDIKSCPTNDSQINLRIDLPQKD